MANNLTVNEEKILVMGLRALRKQAILPMLVNRGYEMQAGEKGSTVTVPVPRPRSAYDVAASATPPSTPDSIQDSVSIVCDKHKGSDFYITDVEMVNTNPDYIEDVMSESVSAIANAVNTDIALETKKFWARVGTAGSTPLASNANAITDARKRLRDNLCPIDDKLCIAWDPAAEANALALPAFQYVNQGGSSSVMTDGDLGRRLGFAHKVVQDLYYHTTGGGSGWLVNQANHAIGDTTVAIDTGSGNPVVGDLFTVAGGTQQFVVTAFAGGTITYAPKAQFAFADNAAITFVASHQNNIAMHKNAIAFVNKPLASASTDGLGSRMGALRDPVSGLVLRLEVTRQNKRNRFELDILYGVQTIRPEFGCRILG